MLDKPDNYRPLIEAIQDELRSIDPGEMRPPRTYPRPGSSEGRAAKKLLQGDGEEILCHNNKNPAVRCTNRFVPEIWQHPTIAWCPTCRKSSEYQSFGGQAMWDARGKNRVEEANEGEEG